LRIEQKIPDSNNLFLTDEHDGETMLIKSVAFDQLLKERGREEKIQAFPKDIRETLLKLGQQKRICQSMLTQGNLIIILIKYSDSAYCLKLEMIYLTNRLGSTLCYNQGGALKTIFSANYAYCSSWHSNCTERLI